MIKYSQIKAIILITILTISGIAFGAKPDAMPQSTYDAIINQVISEHGYYHASEVEEGVSQWLLDQPLPATDGELIESGNCNNCTAGGDHSASSGFNQPQKVKVKAKRRPNGKFPSVLKIEWNQPKALDASLVNDYQVSHYLIYISKDNQSYEILRIDATYLANGKLKKKQQIKFKDRNTGDYLVQVSAIYTPTGTRANTKNLNGTKKTNNTKVVEDEEASEWTTPENFATENDPTTVGEITGALKVCLSANGYPDTKLLLDIQKDLNCSNQNLQDSDIVQLQLLSNIRAVGLRNNPDITDISDLFNLNYLVYLVLSDNPDMIIPDFEKFTALRNLYMENMGLTSIPLLSTNTNLVFLDLSNNQITGGFELLPPNLKVLEIEGNILDSCVGLQGQTESETITISAQGNNLSDCATISGLKYLSVIGGDFDNRGLQDVSAFTTGLCGLSITSTNLTHLKGNAPIVASLALINNTGLLYETGSNKKIKYSPQSCNRCMHLATGFIL